MSLFALFVMTYDSRILELDTSAVVEVVEEEFFTFKT